MTIDYISLEDVIMRSPLDINLMNQSTKGFDYLIQEANSKTESIYITGFLAYLSYVGSDRQVFRIGENIAREFSRSKVSKIKIEDIILPFDAFCISVPLSLGLKNEKGHYFIGAIIADSRSDTSLSELTRKYLEYPDVLIVRAIFVDIKDFEKGELQGISTMIQILNKDEFPEEFVLNNKEFCKQDREAEILITRIIMNSIFYLNSSGRELILKRKPNVERIHQLEQIIKSTKKKKVDKIKKLRKKLAVEKNRETITYIAPSLERQIQESIEKEEVLSPIKTRRKHLVMAHWNYYWCLDRDEKGNPLPERTKHLESRRIKPHYRGSDAAESIRKAYQINHPKGE